MGHKVIKIGSDSEYAKNVRGNDPNCIGSLEPFPAPTGPLLPIRLPIMPKQRARVKSVISGDTLVLTAVDNPSQERILSLAYTNGARIRRDGDEPFAYQSREYLRKLTVGKIVLFQVLYEIPNPHSADGKRQHGRLHLEDGTELPEAAVAAGWLKLRDDAGRKEDTEQANSLLEKLKVAEAKAKSESANVWGDIPKPISVKNDLTNPKEFLSTWKGKPIDSLVERVLSGDRLLVRLLLSPTEHVQTILLVAGIRAPATKRVNPSDKKEQPAEPFGEEAQAFMEFRILQRSVSIVLLGLTPQDQLVGSVRHPRGNMAEFVLKEGLARCSDFHSTMLGGDMAALREAEKSAKDGKRGLFKTHVAQKSTGTGNVEAVVSRIQSADTLYLRNAVGGEKRVNLSSVRQPKPTDPAQASFGAEAKEFLRKKVIGKRVRVTVDGRRPPQDGFDEREMATIVYNDKNIGLLMVENGWAQVVRHRRDDLDRSPIYDELLLAEEEAKKSQKGMWNPKPAAAKVYEDVSETATKAKQRFTLLSRQKRIPAVVDFVKSAARLTVLIPRENQKLTLVLGGIRAPKTARNPSETSEPFGQEAYDLAVRRLLQRDVEIEVEGTDKVGGFIGTLWINRENFAKVLVEEGFASVHAYSAEASSSGNELFAAEKRAQEAHRGRWHDWEPESQSTNLAPDLEDLKLSTNGTNGSTPNPKDYRDIVVTHVDEAGKLKIQQVGTATSKLEALMSKFRTFHSTPANAKPLSSPPKTGDLVSAKFSVDASWYRGRVRSNDRDAKASEILFIDYGNSEKLPWSTLRPLPPQFNTAELKPLALDAVLAFIQLPTTPQYLSEAIDRIYELTSDRQLVASIDNEADNTLFVTLFDPKNSEKTEDSLNADLIAEGSAMVPKSFKAWEKRSADLIKKLYELQDEAIKDRRGLWEYGDLRED